MTKIGFRKTLNKWRYVIYSKCIKKRTNENIYALLLKSYLRMLSNHYAQTNNKYTFKTGPLVYIFTIISIKFSCFAQYG